MKKSIDPNLNNQYDDEIIDTLTGVKTKSDDFHFAENSAPDRISEPNFYVSENGKVLDRKATNNDDPFNNIIEKIDEHQGTHHRSSGSHHHSSGSHHHSSGSHHHSSGSHHHSSDKKKKKKLPLALKIALAIILVFVILIVGVFGFYTIEVKTGSFVGESTITTGEYEEYVYYNGQKYKFNTDVVAVAFLGIDQETLETSDNTDFVGAADADIVFAVDTKTGRASAISIPRDTMVDIDIYTETGTFVETKNAQLCLAYAYGDGAQRSCISATNAISRVLYNVPIQKYFALDLAGISVLNDAIGGVTLTPIYDIPYANIVKGQQVTLHGDMAEAYVRTRDMDHITASGERTERQIQYVKEYSKQLAPAVVKDFGTISRLYNAARDYSQTDLELANLTYLANLMLSKNITTFDVYSLNQGTWESAEDPILENIVHAEFTPDEDVVMQAVLDVFYTPVNE